MRDATDAGTLEPCVAPGSFFALRKAGITLVELVVGLMLAVLVIGAAGLLIVFGANLFGQTAERSQQQTDVTSVASEIAEELRLAQSVRLVVDEPLPTELEPGERIIYIGDENAELTNQGYYYLQEGSLDKKPRNYFGTNWYGNYRVSLQYSVIVEQGKPKYFEITVTAHTANGASANTTSTKSFTLANAIGSAEPHASTEISSEQYPFYLLMTFTQNEVIGTTVEADGDNMDDRYKEWVVPQTGYYQLECWGADGGDAFYSSFSTSGGVGGYATGTVKLNKGDVLYLVAGGRGITSHTAGVITEGGFNGGGSVTIKSEAGTGGSGGGASDIRLGNKDSLYARIIVAGGGGGASCFLENFGSNGGAGGGVSGQGGTTSFTGGGGTQASGGVGAAGYAGSNGSFGSGGSATVNNLLGGGGGGWYGGAAGYSTKADDLSSGGGSGYVWSSATSSSKPTGYLVPNEYFLTDCYTAQHTEENFVEKPTTGHGGYVRISYIGR